VTSTEPFHAERAELGTRKRKVSKAGTRLQPSPRVSLTAQYPRKGETIEAMEEYRVPEGAQASWPFLGPPRKEPSYGALQLLRRSDHFPMLPKVAERASGVAA
jgi:hypothetical protein